MPEKFKQLLDRNREWATHQIEADGEFFHRLADHQEPEFLWIGCSDSRVPVNQVTGAEPGTIFVHRNIANLVIHTDINFLSVLQYAVEVLKVKHIIVCGHYGCGGVAAAMGKKSLGLIDHWLRNIKDVYVKYQDELDAIDNDHDRGERLVELNVIEQVAKLSQVPTVQQAWSGGTFPMLHGWVYSLENGLIRNLNVTRRDDSRLHDVYKYDVPHLKPQA
ncbi:MAG: carbonate dehydratase [Catalinimonas sp.]